MSAPDTNVERQSRRHKPALGGIAIAAIAAAVIAIVTVLVVNVPDTSQATPDTSAAASQ